MAREAYHVKEPPTSDDRLRPLWDLWSERYVDGLPRRLTNALLRNWRGHGFTSDFVDECVSEALADVADALLRGRQIENPRAYRAWLETTSSTPATSSQSKGPRGLTAGPVSHTSTHAVRALRLGPRRLCILAECIRLLSGCCGANLADVRCPGRRGRGFPDRSLRDVHPSRRWCVRSIRSRAWFRRVLHRSWPCA